MAASLAIEIDSGTSTGPVHVHEHNGYYAGDFAPLSHSRPASASPNRTTPDSGFGPAARSGIGISGPAARPWLSAWCRA